MGRNMFSDAALGRICGRVHMGPICVNGGDRGQPICERCGRDVTRTDRELVQHMWNVIHGLLKPHRQAPGG